MRRSAPMYKARITDYVEVHKYTVQWEAKKAADAGIYYVLSLREASLSRDRPAEAPLRVVVVVVVDFVCLKHRNSMPVARRVSARIFLTPSRLVCRFSSPERRA